MEQNDILPERIRRLAIATGIASALALFPILFLLYPALLIVGGVIQPRYPIAGKWFVWAGTANLGVVVAMYDAMMSSHPWRQPKSPAYMVLTFWATTMLLIWCAAELIVDGLRRIWARRSMPPRAPRPASLGAWILAVVLTLFVAWDAKGWALAQPSRYRRSDIFYTLGMAMVQAVLVVAFDISLIRRVLRLRSASRADF
ncbi:MAG TPA: hypothetical protein VKH18_07845 [Terriglobales bacterium]|nr:hypothetical protein [Terriglobales bacterium]